MATILTQSQETISGPEAVKSFLESKGIEYRHWTTGPESQPLLDKIGLADAEKEELLSTLDHRFQELKNQYGYETRDLIVLHPEVPGLPDMLSKFDKMHYHTDDEVRYIVDGTGVFGFRIQGEEFQVIVNRNDFISVPANTHHWFKLDKNMRIKAVRYFKDTSGWTPHYV
jgi:1,2-dihydroxy-3-keto-5-methylthiopentene dioxygenase